MNKHRKMIDPTQDIDRHVSESLGARSQREIVEDIENVSRTPRTKRLKLLSDGIPIADIDALNLTGSVVSTSVQGRMVTADFTAPAATSSGSGAPTTATYITQTADAGLSAEQALSSLSTGMMQSTTTTGVVQTRTLTGTANEVTVTNGDGSGGNPTFGLATGIDATKIGAGGVTSTEFGYIGGLTSDAQTQIDSKAPKSATYIVQTADATLTAEQALGSLATGILKNTTTTGVLSIAVAGTDYAAALNDLTDVAISSARNGSVVAYDGSSWADRMVYTFTLGPFYINDLPGTATTQATLGYFNTATAVSRNANDIKMARSGYVVGAFVVSDAARTAGTATVRVRVSGTDTAFDSGSVALDASNTTSDSSIVASDLGVSFSSGQTLGVNVTTSGWTPTTADLSVWLLVQISPFD